MIVFPAFDDNYKIRKRTFRCCKKCRSKRIRCVILGSDYETYGCDNCRKRGVVCDLARDFKPDDSNPVKVERRESLEQSRETLCDPVTLAHSVGGTQSVSNGQICIPPIYQTPSRTNLLGGLNSISSMYLNQLNPINQMGDTASQIDNSSQDTLLCGIPVGSSAPSSNLRSEGSRDMSPNQWTPRPPVPPFPPTISHAPYVAPTDEIENMIDRIDWRYLKQHWDFNTTIHQSRFYFSKIPSRTSYSTKGNKPLMVALAKRRTAKSKYLGPHNAMHFKFLLAIHAFTLDTPGFCAMSEVDLLQLYEIYFFKVNSVFPIVFESEFWELYKHNVIPSIIIFAVVLTAAQDELAKPILARSFIDKDPKNFKKNHVRFLTELEMKIRQLLIFLPELGDSEKLVRLTTQLLLSHNFKFNKFGNEQSSHDIADCASYAYSLLIHQDFFHVRICQEGALKKSVFLKHLWWVIVIFDRFNATMNGKAMFIARRDFNIAHPTDLPHLNNLVDLAFDLEDTLVAVFRPPRTMGGKIAEGLPEMETQAEDAKFSPAKFIEKEMKIINDVEAMKEIFTDYRKYETRGTHLPGISVGRYRDRMVYFLTRFVSMNIVLILRTGQVKFLNASPHLDDFSLMLSDSFLTVFQMLKDGRGHQLLMASPLIPLLMLAVFSIPLTSRLRIISKVKKLRQDIDTKQMIKVNDLSKNFLVELETFANNWWFVHEVVASIKKLNPKMSKELDIRQEATMPKKRKRSTNPEVSVAKREKLSIHSLVDDAPDSVKLLPTLLSITSPGYYDESIKSSEDEDDDADLSNPKDYESEMHVHNKMLEPPMFRHSMFLLTPSDILTAQDLANRAQEVRDLFNSNAFEDNGRSNVSPGQAGSVGSEEVNFDVGQMAELVSTETSFVPSIMDFFNDQSHEFYM